MHVEPRAQYVGAHMNTRIRHQTPPCRYNEAQSPHTRPCRYGLSAQALSRSPTTKGLRPVALRLHDALNIQKGIRGSIKPEIHRSPFCEGQFITRRGHLHPHPADRTPIPTSNVLVSLRSASPSPPEVPDGLHHPQDEHDHSRRDGLGPCN